MLEFPVGSTTTVSFRTMTKHPKPILVLAAALGLVVTGAAIKPADVRAADARQLSFYHTHTRRSLDVVYYANGEYVDSALDEVNRFLKDFRTGDVTEINPQLLDLLHDVRNELGGDEVYEVISAYRSPKTNEMLRTKTNGVAKKSQHLKGNAIDVRLRGVRTTALRDTALRMQRGGVGFYEESDFVHVDMGPVRNW
jgi:uncharacterized protein YcbK (DUF882 family)